MIRTVLCAVDINRPEIERRVLEVAAREAEQDNAQLDVVTVVPDFGAAVVGAYFEEHHVTSARDTAGAHLQAFVSDVLGAERNAEVRHVVSIGTVYEEVLKAAKANGADLIVIGAHRPDFKDYLLGPNAARVVRFSDCSVYVVR